MRTQPANNIVAASSTFSAGNVNSVTPSPANIRQQSALRQIHTADDGYEPLAAAVSTNYTQAPPDIEPPRVPPADPERKLKMIGDWQGSGQIFVNGREVRTYKVDAKVSRAAENLLKVEMVYDRKVRNEKDRDTFLIEEGENGAFKVLSGEGLPESIGISYGNNFNSHMRVLQDGSIWTVDIIPDKNTMRVIRKKIEPAASPSQSFKETMAITEFYHKK